MPYGDNCSPRRAEPIPSAISRVGSRSQANSSWSVIVASSSRVSSPVGTHPQKSRLTSTPQAP